jgi:prevent-host-death family protein
MRVIAASQARASLPSLLDVVLAGETVVLTRHGRPVAKLTSLDGAGGGLSAAEEPAAYAAGATPVSRAVIDRVPAEAARPLDAGLIGTAATRAVLAPFIERPEESLYQREVVRATGRPLRTVQRELERLVGEGFLTAEHDGNRVYYRAASTPAFRRLSSMLAPRADLILTLRGLLGTLGDAVDLALVFGSIASGGENADSDVDVLVVGDTTRWDLVPLMRQAEREIGREVDVTLYSAADFRERVRARDYFLTAVSTAPHILLIGSLDAVG